MNERIAAPIDNKNICDDFLYDMFDDYNYIEQVNKGKTHLVGFYNGRLLEVVWYNKSNQITFAFVDLLNNKHNESDVEKLIAFIKDFDSEDIIVEINNEGGCIVTKWYFEVK